MSAPKTGIQSKLNGAFQEIKTTLEEIEMKLAVDINNIKTIRSKGIVVKVLGGLALGALLMTATALPFGTTYADGPSRPLVTEETLIDRGADNLAGDAWMYDSPFYQDFSEVGRSEVGTGLLEAQGTPLDAWIYDSPFYQDFSEVGRIGVGTAALEAQGTPLDAWMYDSPFYQDFSEVGRIGVGTAALEAQGTPLDAWMFDSPFYGIS